MENKRIFVFGSDEAGRHGKGVALTAYRTHGAIYGQGVGLQGTSYAIPTKDKNLNTLPLHKIQQYVDTFVKFAVLNPEMKFEVTRIGCGLDEYDDNNIAPLFKNSPDNCILPAGWRMLAKEKQYGN